MSQPRKIRCSVTAVTDHGGRVYSVDLAPDVPVPPFRPGQFLHLTVDAYDPSGFWPESRVFSIASSPRARNQVRICYSVKGRYTTRMEQTLKVGGTAWIKLPYGDFLIGDASDVVLIAGGTGISAFTAFLEALTPETSRRVALVYGVRTPSLFLFQEMLLRQSVSVPELQTIFYAECVVSDSPDQRLACREGRISLNAVWCLLPAPLICVYYLSGPPMMLKSLGGELAARGVPQEHVRTDAWE